MKKFKKIFDLKTYIPEKRVWVLTVAFNIPINPAGNTETAVFPGNEKGITDWGDLYMEYHGFVKKKEILKKKHQEIVEKIKKGEIEI